MKVNYMKMKTVCGWLLFLFAFMQMFVSAKADLVVLPDDDFFLSHEAECESNPHYYLTDGPEGEVVLYKNPESDKEIDSFENGTKLFIRYTYKDSRGIMWGFVDADRNSGWLPMEYMNQIYDSAQFKKDNMDKIKFKEGEFDISEIEGDIYIWDYPGSSNNVIYEDGVTTISYYAIYEDEQGREWASIGYYRVNKGCWLCLDEPSMEFKELFPDEEEGDKVIEAEKKSDEEIVPDTEGNAMLVAITSVIVAAVAAISGITVFKMKKGLDNQTEE